MLFSWARAEMISKRYGLRILAPQWSNYMRIGPWLRHERDKRYYNSNFSNKDYVQGLTRQFILWTSIRVNEDDDWKKSPPPSGRRPRVVDFKGMAGFFTPFLGEQHYINRRIHEIASPAIIGQVGQMSKTPFIAVHIRRGDFQKGGMAVKNEWYLKALGVARKNLLSSMGRDKPSESLDLHVRVFSDGDPETLRFITDQPDVVLMPKAPALLDLLAMSRGKALVATSRSTFSMWAVFLGQMPSYWHPCEVPPDISVEKQSTVVVAE
jgi:hypothetical protein